MSISQKQLASHLGVTPITISRALNNHPSVAVNTRRRIHDAANELGYGGPTTWGAQAMAARRYNRRMPTGVLAVLVTLEQDLPYFEELLLGIKRGCLANGLSILISPVPETGLPLMVEQGRVDGIFLFARFPEIHERASKLNIPIVGLGYRDKPASGLAVLPDSHGGSYQATRHLLDLGHRQIAHITYRYMSNEAEERLTGHIAALTEAGLPTREELLCSSVVNTRDFDIERVLGELLSAAPDVTAINCYNDWIATLTIEALAKRGIRVPEDISVTGFDNLSTASHYSPAISSVNYDRAQMGERAVQLLTQSREQACEPDVVILPVSFIPRETTRQLILE